MPGQQGDLFDYDAELRRYLAQPVAGRGADQPPLPGTTKNKGHRQGDTTGMRNCRPCSSDTISPEES